MEKAADSACVVVPFEPTINDTFRPLNIQDRVASAQGAGVTPGEFIRVRFVEVVHAGALITALNSRVTAVTAKYSINRLSQRLIRLTNNDTFVSFYELGGRRLLAICRLQKCIIMGWTAYRLRLSRKLTVAHHPYPMTSN